MNFNSGKNPKEDDEERLIEAFVGALAAKGIKAESWQSGGDIHVALVEIPGGHDQLWGLAAGTWGGYDTNEDGDEIPDTALITAIAPADFRAAAKSFTVSSAGFVAY